MRAVDHYLEAEGALELLASGEANDDDAVRAAILGIAQVHATLALAGATAMGSYARVDDEASDAELDDWLAAAGGDA